MISDVQYIQMFRNSKQMLSLTVYLNITLLCAVSFLESMDAASTESTCTERNLMKQRLNGAAQLVSFQYSESIPTIVPRVFDQGITVNSKESLGFACNIAPTLLGSMWSNLFCKCCYSALPPRNSLQY